MRRAYGQQAFAEGHMHLLSWSNGSRMMCYVRLVRGRLSFILSYKADEQDKTEIIPLTTTDCEFGGVRYWMHCPRCSRRCAKLYRAYGCFRCRKCHNLTYTSSQEAHRFDSLGILGTDFKKLDQMMKVEALIQKWDDRKRLTKGERRKIAAALGLPLFMIRSRWYRRTTRAKQVAEEKAFVDDLLK